MKTYTHILGSVFANTIIATAMDAPLPGIGKGAAHYEWSRQINPEQPLVPPAPVPVPPPGQWIPPTTTSTTSIDWWPYHTTSPTPAYAPTDAMVPPNPSFIIPVPAPVEVPPAPSESTSPSAAAISSSTTCTQSDCPISITSSSSFSSTSSQPSSSSAESQSLIQITAISPAASSSVTPSASPKMNPVSLNATSLPRTRVILICVSAGVGLLAGSVVAWFCFGFCMTRRRRKNGSFWKSWKNKVDLRAGPEYSQTWAEDLDHEKHIGQPFEQTEDMKSLHRASQSQSTFSWDIPTRPPARDSERQSFLAPPGKMSAKPSRSPTRKSARSAMRRNTTKSVYSTLTGYEASPDPMALLSEFEEHEDTAEHEDEELIRDARNGRQKPYESLRKGSKTIRRELLERVRQTSGSQVRRVDGTLDVDGGRKVSARRRVSRGHHRANSDVVIEDGRVTTQHSGQDSGYQAEAAGAHDEDDQTRWVEGSGFRIVEEEVKSMWGAVGEWASGARNPEAGTTAAPQERKSIFSSWVGKSNEGADTYTPLPSRSSPSKSQARVNRVAQSNGFGRPERRDREGDRPGLPRVDSSVLPRSPPQIMSPPLASQLFFTPQAPQEAFPRRGG